MKTSTQIIEEAVENLHKLQLCDGHFETTGEFDRWSLEKLFRSALSQSMKTAVESVTMLEDENGQPSRYVRSLSDMEEKKRKFFEE